MACARPEQGEPLKFLRAGHSPELLRKLRRGHWRIEEELDLHGLNGREAAVVAGAFIGDAAAAARRCVRIVHGKGLGVLREALRTALPARAEVLGFVEASAAQGGSGAVLVLLKS
jgi:DNA-nicking Smr family endonuclease